MAYHTAQPQRCCIVQLAAHITQSAANTTQQGVDGSANAQAITHLLGHIGDGGNHRRYRVVQSTAHITQNRVQPQWQNVIYGLSDIAQCRLQDRLSPLCQQDTPQA